MSLQELTKSIVDEAEKEAREIAKNASAEILGIEKAYGEKAAEARDMVEKRLEYRAQQQVEQVRFELQHETSNALLKEKRAALDAVYQDALTALSQLDAEKTTALLVGLLKGLPDVEGEIVPTAASSDALKAALSQSGRSFGMASDTAEGTGGFLFRGKGLMIDHRYEALIAEARDKSETQVSELLFTESK